jgi:hypothetical protein
MGTTERYLTIAQGIMCRFINDDIPHVACQASTDPGIGIVSDDGQEDIVSAPPNVTEQQSVDAIVQLLEKGRRFGVADAVRVYTSPHRRFLSEAWSVLRTEIMPFKHPRLDSVLAAIEKAGLALANQVDTDPVIRSLRLKGRNDNVEVKLRNLGLQRDDEGLFEEYLRLHPFYNATKHANSSENIDLRERLGTVEGREIALAYYHTVDRILNWYYKMRGNRADSRADTSV